MGAVGEKGGKATYSTTGGDRLTDSPRYRVQSTLTSESMYPTSSPSMSSASYWSWRGVLASGTWPSEYPTSAPSPQAST